MFNSSSSSASSRPTLSSSSSSSPCTLNSSKHASKPPIIASPSPHDLHAHTHIPHPALLIPLSHCHHLHSHPHLDSPRHLYPLPHSGPVSANLSNNASGRSRIVSESFGSHSCSTDPHCYTTDCSPRSVICHLHSSTSSGPSPDPGRPRSYSPRCISNVSTPRAKSHNLAATCSSIASRVPHCPTALHAAASPASLLSIQSQQSMMQSHLHRYPPWSSPAAIHHPCLDASSRSFSASSERSYTTAGLQAANYLHHEAETEEGNDQDTKMRRSPKLVQKGSPKPIDIQRERLFRPGYSFGSTAVDKPCVNVESKEGDGKQAAAMEAIMRGDTESEYDCNSHPHGYPRGPIALSDSSFNSVQKGVDHRQRIHEIRSYSCNLHTAERVSRSSSRQSCSAIFPQARKATMTPKTPDALLGYADGMASHHDQHPAARGSKWEDAEKWLTPANYNHHHHHHQQHQDHHPTGCRGLIPSLGLLRMSDCMNAHGAAIEPVHFLSPPAVNNAPYTADYLSAHTQCTLSSTLANYSTNHSLHTHFDAASLQNDSSSAQEQQANKVVNHPSRQLVHVNCFHPQLMSCNFNFPYAQQCCPAPHDLGASNQSIIGGQVSKQWNAPSPQFQVDGTTGQLNLDSSGSSTDLKHNKLRQWNAPSPQFQVEGTTGQLNLDSSGSRSSIKEAVPSLNERRMLPLPPPRSAHHHHHQSKPSQLTDRFASGDSIQCSTELMYVETSDKDIFVGPNMQGNVAIPLVSLREVGTQMSSIDGSGSISRYTSKNGSPQKTLSPARHNTPARMRSLSGSASNSSNVRRSAKQFINLEELVECHRAKLELQALSEGERLHSFHRTTSTWSSREVEEADLSRSLRHSTPELENQSMTNSSHQWPTQSYSWTKDEDSKLAKLQLKEAQIQAWEAKKKSKADAKLKRLEENLAKKRSQNTTRIMETLAAAQRKAEEMRASVYAQQRRSFKKGHPLRPRSLSPFSQCSCFSVAE